MWEHRNGILFNKQQGMPAEHLTAEIQLQFQIGFEGLPPNLQQASQRSLEDILKASLEDHQEWLGRIQAGRNYRETRENRE